MPDNWPEYPGLWYSVHRGFLNHVYSTIFKLKIQLLSVLANHVVYIGNNYLIPVPLGCP